MGILPQIRLSCAYVCSILILSCSNYSSILHVLRKYKSGEVLVPAVPVITYIKDVQKYRSTDVPLLSLLSIWVRRYSRHRMCI